MRLQVHIKEKTIVILLPNNHLGGVSSDFDNERYLTEPVFESQIIVDWLIENEIDAVIKLETDINMVDLQLGSKENEKKFLDFIAASDL